MLGTVRHARVTMRRAGTVFRPFWLNESQNGTYTGNHLPLPEGHPTIEGCADCHQTFGVRPMNCGLRFAPAPLAMMLIFGRTATSLALLLPGTALLAQTGPTPHPLGSVVATATTPFNRIGQVVSQSDGHVFVTDAGNRILWRFDGALANPTMVLDSAGGKDNSFSANSFLMPFGGDSALFDDARAKALVVIGPTGEIARVMASPPTGASTGPPFAIRASQFGYPTFSPVLGLVYKWLATAPLPMSPPPATPAGGEVTVRTGIDTMAVVRMNFATRAIDTVARLSTDQAESRTFRNSKIASSSGYSLPFPFYDEVVVTTDGSIAIFHAREYRIEWINVDGTRSAGVRMPFAWQRISEADRARFLDSLNGLKRHTYDSLVARRAADSASTGAAPTTTRPRVSADGVRTEVKVSTFPPQMETLTVPEDIPDFRPPTGVKALLADADDHIWIRPLPPVPQPGADAVWDVIDRQSQLIDRVRVPDGVAIAGFAPGGFVFLIVRRAGVPTLEKVRVR